MIYQLPTGKIIYLTLEDYLNLTPEDIQYLVSTGIGATPSNPFYGSAIKKPGKKDTEDPFDRSLDYEEDNDDIEIDSSINLDEIPDEDSFLEE